MSANDSHPNVEVIMPEVESNLVDRQEIRSKASTFSFPIVEVTPRMLLMGWTLFVVANLIASSLSWRDKPLVDGWQNFAIGGLISCSLVKWKGESSLAEKGIQKMTNFAREQ